MSEDEIIFEVKKYIECKYADGRASTEAIRGLLDLYKQEKESKISKDKIREKIESIENSFEVCDEEINYKLKIEDKAKIEVLKELLEEE